MDNSQLHSAEYFGEQRDFWWNRDFVEVMAHRWQLQHCYHVLDVGCGLGHWSRVLSPFLPPGAQVTGIDQEAEWIRQAPQLNRSSDIDYDFRVANANALPFADESFDMVTCQTLLIHLKDPQGALREWIRVLKPGGLLAVAEPNNLAGHAVFSSLDFFADPEVNADYLRFVLVCERGKWQRGEGHNSIGDLLPGYFAEAGLEKLQVYLSDKASPLVPPYASAEQRALLEQSEDWVAREIGIWSREESKTYYLAGGGNSEDFENLWQRLIMSRRQSLQALREKKMHCAGGSIVYLVSGRKKVA